MAIDASTMAVGLPIAVGLVSASVAVAAWHAVKQTGNPRIRYIAAGFALFAIKSEIKAWHLSTGPESTSWEIALSLLDLVSLLLIAWPLLRVWRRRLP